MMLIIRRYLASVAIAIGAIVMIAGAAVVASPGIASATNVCGLGGALVSCVDAEYAFSNWYEDAETYNYGSADYGHTQFLINGGNICNTSDHNLPTNGEDYTCNHADNSTTDQFCSIWWEKYLDGTYHNWSEYCRTGHS